MKKPPNQKSQTCPLFMNNKKKSRALGKKSMSLGKKSRTLGTKSRILGKEI
jgi:hypothetical protein